MITLTKKLRREGDPITNGPSSKRASVRDRLLIKEVQEMEQTMPATCKTYFDDSQKLHEFSLTVTPDEGYWLGGKFRFQIYVTEEYNMAPPQVKCLTKLWHPNISEDGDICLSLLRQSSIDGLGWAPTRKLKDVDLLNFDDPLNIEAAEQFAKDKEAFRCKVKDYVHQYAKR
ncbi:hypothetical protein B566_EDAN014994 [Ephemera danica]|nr:hypothetical protein B566_EDAN014994 [Ephemera danica]